MLREGIFFPEALHDSKTLFCQVVFSGTDFHH